MNLCNIRKTFSDYKIKGWDRIYVLVDAHGTIIPSGEHDEFTIVNSDCVAVLRWFNKRKECRIILWTSSYKEEINKLVLWLWEKHRITIDYVNKNTEAKDTKRASFKEKPYYNIVIDDRAGFEPETDWKAIREELQSIGEW